MAPSPPVSGKEKLVSCHRPVALTQELVSDCATQWISQPLDSGAKTVGRAACGTVRAGCEILGKRIALPVSHLVAKKPPTPKHAKPKRPHAPGVEDQPAQVELALDGAQALEGLERLIGSADQRIDILMYIWENDVLGWSLAHTLADKAKTLAENGAPSPTVRVVIDRGGNLIHSPTELGTTEQVNAVVTWLAAQPHVQVIRNRFCTPRFDHRKLVLIDGQTAWSGGRNFTLLSFFDYRDVSYILNGPLVAELAKLFEEAWASAGGQPCPVAPVALAPTACVNATAHIVATGPWRRDLASSLYRAVDDAQDHIYIENPYFTDSLLLCKLVKARRRGVDVRVLVARDSDSMVLDHATRLMVNRLLDAGVDVYWRPGTTHLKAASVDGCWAYIGTGNFDGLSLSLNNEVGLVVVDGPMLEEIEDHLLAGAHRAEWQVTEHTPVTVMDHVYDWLAGLLF